MTVFGFLILLILIFLVAVSFLYNRNITSPFKILLLNIIVFWGDIFYIRFPDIIYFYFILVVLVLIFVLIWEIKYKPFLSNNIYFSIDKTILHKRIWLLTLIPSVAQFLFVQEMGGISGYIHSINLRVVLWQGYGIYITLIRLILIINFIYFVILLRTFNLSKKDYFLFGIHMVIFIVIGLLSGSRSTLLVNFVLMAIYYNQFHKRVPLIKFLFIGLLVLIFSFVIGVARYGYNYSDGTLITGFQNENIEKRLETANFSYGTFPLEVISAYPQIKDIYFGKTYLTVFTNLFPRFIWPNKPDTGGVIFTEKYQNVHDGYSNYSTGFITEGIINFGDFLGPFVGFFIMIIIWQLFFKFYSGYYIKKLIPLNYFIYFLFFPILMFLLPTYLHGEFTTVTHSIFINRLLPGYFILKYIFFRNKPRLL